MSRVAPPAAKQPLDSAHYASCASSRNGVSPTYSSINALLLHLHSFRGRSGQCHYVSADFNMGIP